ncbi:acetoin utilization protein AcuB [Ammoniphilus oxalaticus]|uniref:Acetoin utilization protein AcuB n=1 Tax=Ammoniphilus oxalaticus TaxID=66863 RepID=A0A419SR77_9BACL|nr:CBS and ACT domain-containing protein [Ammoniphilus oxalaticus]RKD27022.1 acetoin utilization protein AcuB [Ammoniphilus oxalaticus]
MLVEDIMNRNLVTIKPYETIRLAMLLTAQHRIRHLPVVDDTDKLVGIVSDRDLRDAGPSRFDNESDSEQNEDIFNRKIQDLMNKNVITAHPLDFVEEAAYALYENKIGCLPVVDGDNLKGIITDTDILYTLVELMGVHTPSSHVEIQVDDLPGMLADISAVFKKANYNVNSVLTFPGKHQGKKNLMFRVQAVDTRRLVQSLQESGFDVIWPKEPEK